MTIKELKIKRFLKEDLGMNPKYAVFDTLKEMISLLDDSVDNKQGILSATSSNTKTLNKNTRRISFYIERHSKDEKFIKVLGSSNIITAKEFVINCFDYYNERYN